MSTTCALPLFFLLLFFFLQIQFSSPAPQLLFLLLFSLLTKFTVSNLTISGIDDAKRPIDVWALRRGLLFGEWMLLGGKGLRQ